MRHLWWLQNSSLQVTVRFVTTGDRQIRDIRWMPEPRPRPRPRPWPLALLGWIAKTSLFGLLSQLLTAYWHGVSHKVWISLNDRFNCVFIEFRYYLCILLDSNLWDVPRQYKQHPVFESAHHLVTDSIRFLSLSIVGHLLLSRLALFVVIAWTRVQSFDRFFKSVIPHPTVIDLHPLLSRMIVLFYAGDCCHSDAKLPLISCSTVTPTLQSLLSIPLSCIPCTSNSSCDRKWNLNPILLRLLTTHRILW